MDTSKLNGVRIEQHPTPGSLFDFELDLDKDAQITTHSYPSRIILLTNLNISDLVMIRNEINDAISKSQ